MRADVCPKAGRGAAGGGAARGVELMAGAVQWIADNPLSWAALVATCRECAAAGLPCSRTNVTFLARRRRLVVSSEPDCTRFEHALWTPLARLIAAHCPDLDFPSARCCVDEAYPTPGDLPALPGGCEPGEGGRWGVPAVGGEGR